MENTTKGKTMPNKKPHMGTINNWFKQECPSDLGLGYAIEGMSLDHSYFAGGRMRTSYVVKHEGNEIETRNSCYTLGTAQAEVE